MKCILLALALVCGIQANTILKPMKDLDISMMCGDWFTMAIATENENNLVPQTAPLHVFFTKMNVNPQGNMEITLNKWVKKDQCVQETILALKTDETAHFTMNYQQMNQMFVVDAAQDHMITCLKNSAVPQSLTCFYLTKTVKPNQDEVMEKFLNFLKDNIMNPKVVLDFTQKNEPCHV